MDIISNLIRPLIQPVSDIVDQAVVDKDERERLKYQIELAMVRQAGAVEQAARDVLVAEIKGDSWLQRSWRPICMLTFLIMLVSYWFGLTPDVVNENETALEACFNLLSLGLGGYVLTRGGEKIMREYKRK